MESVEIRFKYSVDNSEVTITGYEGSKTEVTIPTEIDGKPVTSIKLWAFLGCSSLSSLKSITIPNSVTSIGFWAFGNSGVKTIYGEKGSYAETYANENDIAFKDIMNKTIVTSEPTREVLDEEVAIEEDIDKSDIIFKFNESKRKALAHMREKGLSLDIIATEFNCTVEEIEFVLTLIDKK